VLAQRLIRRLCAQCATRDEPDPGTMAAFEAAAGRGGLEWGSLRRQFMKAVGCARCAMTGYRGRVPVAETLVVTPEIAQAIRRGASVDELRSLAVQQGMTTLAADTIHRAASGAAAWGDVAPLL
jgi:type II secretory ATPase GspE/PulE/Tfp pilus assembly ATPase PilB-like protein